MYSILFFSSRRRHTRCALVTGVQTCALPISVRRAGKAARQARRLGLPSGLRRGRVSLPPRPDRRPRRRDRARLSPPGFRLRAPPPPFRSEEHTSELQSLMRTSYAVFCLKKKNKQNTPHNTNHTDRLNCATSHVTPARNAHMENT